MGGNIGNPLIAYVEGPQDDDWVVAEISSFQLEGVSEFRPKISVLLNLTEDHLDRYETFAEYVAAKERIFAKQKKEDYALLNADDRPSRWPGAWKPRCFSSAPGGRSRSAPF